MVLVTMKFAVVGRPAPSNMQVTIVRSMVMSKFPLEIVIIKLAILSPSPVKVAIPTIIPTVPQAHATPSDPFAPFTKPSISFGNVSLVSLDIKDTAIVVSTP